MKHERLTNEKVRLRFGNVTKLSEIWKARLLLFIGRTARQTDHRLCYKDITATICIKRIIGRLFRINKDAIVETIRKLILSTLHFGNTEYWARYTADELNWNDRILLHITWKS